MIEQLLDFVTAYQEYIIPIVLLILGEIITLKFPTKDPAGLTERVGRILRILLEARVENKRKNFQGKEVNKPHNK